MSSPRYLTKSRFKLALECETKLFYTRKPEYPDKKVDDSFMEALAEGGFQVGELAKLYHPGGVMVKERDYERSLKITGDLLKQDNAIIYEAAFRHKNLFIRTDVIVKTGNAIDLIEVKAKSFGGRDSMDLTKNNGQLDKSWSPYIYDVAFQKYALTNAYPGFTVNAYLMLANKNSKTTVDGLNQKFRVTRDRSGNAKITVSGDISKDGLGSDILVKVNIDDLLGMIYEGTDGAGLIGKPFYEQVRYWAECYKKDTRLQSRVGKKCRDCEFYCTAGELAKGKRDGRRECWKREAGFTDSDFHKPSVLDIWSYNFKDDLIREGKYFMSDITEEDIGQGAPKGSGMTRSDRQRIQVQKAVSNDNTMLLLADELKDEMMTWKYPLHFIDFETAAVAIPFYKYMHPYEVAAFQFSHHAVDKKGNIQHRGEYINVERGKFPNFEFVRALKEQLEQDQGTIFRFATHENTILNIIYRQLLENTSIRIEDKEELLYFIMSITRSTRNQSHQWEGTRNMVDLCDLVKRFYYDPYTHGANSIKTVLPAVLNRSKYLQEKYSKPVYGTKSIPSLNFKDHTWIRQENGEVVNPYKQLPPLFEGINEERLKDFVTDPDLAEGGAAMMAYARMQFSEMSDEERMKVKEGLLRYCELDTFAMVLIWEFWNEEV
ncbi:MAG: DUF2779 domain-containing protein [Bacteroidales bacterium]|nr:DUF2779 domain-containing protein [Bacteroidales bacterium]